jgi:hypothetical protein
MSMLPNLCMKNCVHAFEDTQNAVRERERVTHTHTERDLAKNPKWQKETDMEAACGVAGTHGRSATHEGRWRAGPPCPYSHTRSHDLPSSPHATTSVGHESACPFLRAQARQKELEELEQMGELKHLLSTSSVALG